MRYSPASRFTLRLAGLGGGAEACLTGALPLFLACGTSLVLWLVVAAVAVFGGMVGFLALGLGLVGGGAWGAEVSGPLGRGFSMNEKVNRKQLTNAQQQAISWTNKQIHFLVLLL